MEKKNTKHLETAPKTPPSWAHSAVPNSWSLTLLTKPPPLSAENPWEVQFHQANWKEEQKAKPEEISWLGAARGSDSGRQHPASPRAHSKRFAITCSGKGTLEEPLNQPYLSLSLPRVRLMSRWRELDSLLPGTLQHLCPSQRAGRCLQDSEEHLMTSTPRLYFSRSKNHNLPCKAFVYFEVTQVIFAIKHFSLDINNSHHARTEVWAFLFFFWSFSRRPVPLHRVKTLGDLYQLSLIATHFTTELMVKLSINRSSFRLMLNQWILVTCSASLYLSQNTLCFLV